MNLLAVDTSGPAAGAAVYKEGRILCQVTLENKKTHSEKIMGLIDFALVQSGVAREEIEAIAVASGPGSFTGIRIGMCIAKAMAQALDIPIICVNTLDALCHAAPGGNLRCAVMDARRQEVYCAAYDESGIAIAHGAKALDDFLWEVKARDREAVFCGDAVRVYRERIVRALGQRASFMPEPFCVQCAAAVAMVAAESDRSDDRDAYTAKPNYFRLSQAEREAIWKKHDTVG